MATTLPAQWAQVHTRIGIERDDAINAHTTVREALETDPTLRAWGVDTVLIGSYKRRTAIHPCKDVDVFVKLPNAPADASPETVFTEVQRALVESFGSRATEQRRSMKVAGFADGLTVDAVPAVRSGARWRIPETASRERGMRQIKDRWEETDPERLTDLTVAVQTVSPLIGGDPSYLRMVRIMKQVRDAQIGRDAKPGGLYMELLTYWAFMGGARADSYAELLVAVLDSVAAQLRSGLRLVEPAMNQPYEPQPDLADLARAGEAFLALASRARRALDLDDCAAAHIWREMLGRNDKVGWCFPLPPGCSDSGTRIVPLANKDRGPNDDRGFA